jgi:hypothetical protein
VPLPECCAELCRVFESASAGWRPFWFVFLVLLSPYILTFCLSLLLNGCVPSATGVGYDEVVLDPKPWPVMLTNVSEHCAYAGLDPDRLCWWCWWWCCCCCRVGHSLGLAHGCCCCCCCRREFGPRNRRRLREHHMWSFTPPFTHNVHTNVHAIRFTPLFTPPFADVSVNITCPWFARSMVRFRAFYRLLT